MQEDRNTDITKENTDILENKVDIPSELKVISEDEMLDTVVITDEFETEEELCDLLKQQVKEELDIQQLLQDGCKNEPKSEPKNEPNSELKKTGSKKTKKRILITIGIILIILLISTIFLVGTKGGRRLIYRFAGNLIYNQLDKEEDTPVNTVTVPEINTEVEETQTGGETLVTAPVVAADPRQEDYVKNFLIFGIEEIEGASNTDSMMIASINTRDNTIKLTSLLRDTYVTIPGKNPNKLNSVYAQGGSDLLINTIEQNYRIKIDGFAHIDFNSFESIVDLLGGIEIELGEKEANYLNTTNYISNPANRTVTAGMNYLNGNQALGYCRVRKCETLGGANNDYGRTLRQRRVLTAIFEKYKSQSFINLLSTMNECLSYVTTNITAKQIENCLENIVENKITTMKTMRIPIDETFETPNKYNGVIDPLVINWDDNIKEIYKFIFLDNEAEAEVELAAQTN